MNEQPVIYPCWAVAHEDGRTPPLAVFGADALVSAQAFAKSVGLPLFQAAAFAVVVNRNKDWAKE